MAKNIDLTSEKWIDMVFEGKNKDFGAYTLRKNSPKRHTFAFLIVTVLIALILIGAQVITAIQDSIEAKRQAMTEVVTMTNIELEKPEVPEENEVKQFEAPPPVELKSTIQFTAPVIKDDDEVAEDKEVKAQTEVIDAKVDVSIADIKGTDEEHGVDISVLEQNKIITQDDSKKEEEKVYDIVEIDPSFPGGDKALYKFLGDNIVYPPIAEENGIEGKVTCQFVVGRDGSIENVKILRGVEKSLDKEAVRVIKMMPKWIPGKQGGTAVKVKYILPIVFKIKTS